LEYMQTHNREHKDRAREGQTDSMGSGQKKGYEPRTGRDLATSKLTQLKNNRKECSELANLHEKYKATMVSRGSEKKRVRGVLELTDVVPMK